MGARLPILLLAIAALIAGSASAEAGVGGGVSPGGDSGGGGSSGAGNGSEPCSGRDFGWRSLRFGDCGKDVKTLNWILKAGSYAVPLDQQFGGSTRDSVRDYEQRRDLEVDGVVERETRKALVGGLRRDRASWYGPGFWGNRTACGQKLRKDSLGVAHRSLPCGTKVVIGHRGDWVRARVIDRGPYVKRRFTRDWDLTKRTARKVGLTAVGTGKVRAGVIR
jgi:peptidoglycan hydrolase-like protein with peptidoglycan-binding domain